MADVTNTRALLATEALRQSIRHGNVHDEHQAIFQAAINRQEAHVRLSPDVVKRQAQFK